MGKAAVTKHSRAEQALARAAVYRTLALAFAYPMGSDCTTLRAQAAETKRLAAAIGGRARNLFARFEKELSSVSDSELEETHLRVFTHIAAPDCNPCETSYTARHLFQVSQQLSDISAFYTAFGLEPFHERVDHITVELEFMAFLAFKESYARANHGRAEVLICRRGQSEFLASHLTRWAHIFADFVDRKAAGGVYADLAKLTRQFVADEAKQFRLTLEAGPSQRTPLPMLQTPGADGEYEPVFPIDQEVAARWAAEGDRKQCLAAKDS